MQKSQSFSIADKFGMSPLVKLAKRIVPDSVKLVSKARIRTGGRIGLNLPDRTFLEKVSIPWFVRQHDVSTILDVGTDWYTWKYDTLFPGKEYHSIDLDVAKAKFASSNHVIGSILELDQYFEEGKFDLIICNGVFGWGVNGATDIAVALSQFSRVLRKGGYLVIGWNDNDEHRPEGVEMMALEGFETFVLPSIESDCFSSEAANRHQFRFYRAVDISSSSSLHESIVRLS